MNRATAEFCAALAALVCWAAPAEEKKADALAVPLPPLVRVSSVDAAGQTWQQSGEIGGSVEGASRAFARAFGANGWQLSKRIAMGRLKGRSQLLVLTRSQRRVLVMVWAKEAGRCGFAWGNEQ